MFPRAVSRSGRSLKPAHFALYYAQRIVTLPKLRTVTAKVLAGNVNRQHPQPAEAPSPDSERVLSILRSQGCSEAPLILAPDKLTAIRKYLDNAEVKVGERAYRGAPNSLPAGVTADYPIETLIGCNELVELANHPFALKVAREYLGCAPTISTIAVRWSTPEAKAANITQQFHRDYDDWRFLKFFVYLNDVDLESGPHTYALGSHLHTARLLARPYSDEQVEKDLWRKCH